MNHVQNDDKSTENNGETSIATGTPTSSENESPAQDDAVVNPKVTLYASAETSDKVSGDKSGVNLIVDDNGISSGYDSKNSTDTDVEDEK